MGKSKEELQTELEDLEQKEFMLQMIDRWSSEDYRYYDELHDKIRNVKKEMIKYENE